MEIQEAVRSFKDRYGKSVESGGVVWPYYRLGQGTPILWLTGGLRRAALGYSFLKGAAKQHTVIAPDYPPMQHVDEFIQAVDKILETEKIIRFILAGQSYGSMLAQAYLSARPERVETLVISSGGPADYSRIWLAADYLAIALFHILPERSTKKLFLNGLRKVLPSGSGKQAEWVQVVQYLIMEELTRADLVSHFAVSADMIQKRAVKPEVLRYWQGRLIVLSSANDPTQSDRDAAAYERLFGRPAEWFDLGGMGHVALLTHPQPYLDILEQALSG
ncbi:MAG: alpha/beta hydrolase [Anaerolineaceae bacterium]|nr:alpha/beta hydrolase [Anaerolineaceae bacterium]MBN2677876.1 alpha/beta hydrolase [Anaerolineaceae bacterium]